MANGKKTKKYMHKHKNVHTLLISLAVVMCWRGAWGLMDMYIFPHDKVIGLVISVVIGLLLIFILDHHKIRDIFN